MGCTFQDITCRQTTAKINVGCTFSKTSPAERQRPRSVWDVLFPRHHLQTDNGQDQYGLNFFQDITCRQTTAKISKGCTFSKTSPADRQRPRSVWDALFPRHHLQTDNGQDQYSMHFFQDITCRRTPKVSVNYFTETPSADRHPRSV